jgi:Barrel-sandwich domain of CusB or HlyD membrane-fusion
MKKAILRLFGLAILVAAGWGGYRFFKQLPERQETIPTAKVQRGDVVIRAYSRGELHAIRAQTITAPNLFGTVQVTRLAPMGALAKEKDLIVEYDDSERQAALEEAQLSVQSVDEQIKKAKADLAIQQSQDQVTLLKTRYDVKRAEFEVQKNDIIDAIDAKKNILQLDQSKRALQQLEADIQARQEQADSQLAVLVEQRNRSVIDVQRELQRIAQTKALSPMTGLVAIKQNRAGYFNFGQQLPDIREGDTLQPGMPVADVLDLSELEVWTKIGELDRANLVEGQDALIQLDAIPDKQFRGKIKAMSGTATSDVFSGDPSKKFDVIFSIDMRQLLTALGMKEADIANIMATAAANAKKVGSANTGPSFFAGLQAQVGGPDAAAALAGGMSGMQGMPGAAGTQEQTAGQDQSPDAAGAGRNRGQGGQGGQARGQAGAGGGRNFGANLSEQDRAKLNDLRQKMQKATGEEQQKLRQQMQELMQKAGINPGGRGGAGGGGFGGGRRGGGNMAMVNILDLKPPVVNGFTEEDRKAANLPKPPEEDSQVQTLLRPGLLADVEIIVEKIPNALHVPAQAVFEKGGNPTVFVLQKNGKFEPREVQLVKRSETMMVLSGGVQPGEVIAMADPTADKADKKGKNDKKSGGGAMGVMPAGGK